MGGCAAEAPGARYGEPQTGDDGCSMFHRFHGVFRWIGLPAPIATHTPQPTSTTREPAMSSTGPKWGTSRMMVAVMPASRQALATLKSQQARVASTTAAA